MQNLVPRDYSNTHSVFKQKRLTFFSAAASKEAGVLRVSVSGFCFWFPGTPENIWVLGAHGRCSQGQMGKTINHRCSWVYGKKDGERILQDRCTYARSGHKGYTRSNKRRMESNQVIRCKPDSPLRQDALRQEPESFKIPLLLRLVVSSLNLKVIGSAYD